MILAHLLNDFSVSTLEGDMLDGETEINISEVMGDGPHVSHCLALVPASHFLGNSRKVNISFATP